MRLPSFAATTFALLTLAGPALAADPVQGAADAFVKAKGFQSQNLENIEGALADLIGGDRDAMIPPGADISPIEKAFLLLDTQETPLPRSRYLLRYNEQVVGGITLSLIDIERYNLGPAVRAETIAEFGADQTAEPAAFGIGPHVEWRIVTQPVAKAAALLLAASRREISDSAAAARDCLPRTCLSLTPLDGVATWSEGEQRQEPFHVVAYPAIGPSEFDPENHEIVPAYQALELGIMAGIATADDAGGVSWAIPGRQGGNNVTPLLVIEIDHNLGQDIFSDAALGIGKLGKDSAERWVRIGGNYFDKAIAETRSTAEGALKNSIE